MKILVICQYFYPETFQINEICKQLAADGNDVMVLTGLPNYPEGVVWDEYKKGKRRDEYYYGVHVIRCFEVGRRKGAVRLALNYLSFWISSVLMVNKLDNDFDLVFVYQLSPVMMGFAGRKYAMKHSKPLFLYCCDLWPESIKMYVKSESSVIFRLFKRISRSLYSNCNKIACQSSSFLQYMRSVHDIPEEKLVYIPAFADDRYLTEDFTAEDETIDFVFLGNIGIAQNLTVVLSAIEQIRDISGFKVHFVGDGVCLNELKHFVSENELDDIVYFYGRRSVEEMPKFYKLADACLVSLNADNQTGLTLPSKVQGYMAAGKPIIGMINGSAKAVIEESKCGICVDTGDINGLAEAMRDFILNREKYTDCGENGRSYFKKHFCKAAFMNKLNAEIKELTRK